MINIKDYINAETKKLDPDKVKAYTHQNALKDLETMLETAKAQGARPEYIHQLEVTLEGFKKGLQNLQ